MGTEEVQQLRGMLQEVQAFPVAGQQWASLGDGLMVNDDPALARLFEQTPGVVLLHLPAETHRWGSLHLLNCLFSCLGDSAEPLLVGNVLEQYQKAVLLHLPADFRVGTLAPSNGTALSAGCARG